MKAEKNKATNNKARDFIGAVFLSIDSEFYYVFLLQLESNDSC